jgi:hypothetical protein
LIGVFRRRIVRPEGAASVASRFPEPGRRPGRAIIAKVSAGVALLAIACAGSQGARWAASVPSDEIDLALAALPPDAQRAFLPLTEVFYDRITSRRFNSRATFDDPSMRQFFPSVATYSDYYAALVDVLDRNHFLNNQPTRIDLLGVSVVGDGVIRLSLRFVGGNDLPLRWWNATLLRTDEWRWRDGRWWVVPGKV